MTNISKDKILAGDLIPPKCGIIEVHVGELKQLFDAMILRRFAIGTWIRKPKSSLSVGPRICLERHRSHWWLTSTARQV
jgi:hypothetical protein